MRPRWLRTTRQALRESEERFRTLFEEAPVAYHEIDARGLIRRVNRAECELLGFTALEMIGRPVWDFVAPDGREASREAVRAKLAGARELVPFQRDYERRDGRVLTLEIHENYIRGSNGEIHGIRSALLDITERKQAQERLHQYAVEVDRQNEALAAALAAAQEATTLKRQFLANMSHEVRTPMNGVLGMVDLLLQTPLDPEQREYTETIRQSAEALHSLINDVLDFSHIEAGKLEIESTPFDPAGIVREVAFALAARAQAKRLSLDCRIEPDLPPLLRGDGRRFRQVVWSIAENAIKFTERGGVSVWAGVIHQSGRQAVVRVTVADTGVGIPPKVRARLFESFVQGDGSSTRRHSGAGLGLALSSHLVERMGGEIEVGSEMGKGSVFTITIPFDKVLQAASLTPVLLDGQRILVVDGNGANRVILRRWLQSWRCSVEETATAEDALARLDEAAQTGRPFRLALLDVPMPEKNGEELARSIRSIPALRETTLIALSSALAHGDVARLREVGFAEILQKPVRRLDLWQAVSVALAPCRPAFPQPAPPPPPPSPQTRRHRILVAEDNDVNLRIVLRMLSKLGCQADSVRDGRQAAAAVEGHHYDLVLMDIQMPEMDGFEAAAEIRRQVAPARPPPIIAMTAHAMPGDREKCLAAGMDDYIAKPIRLEVLRATLLRWLPESGFTAYAEAAGTNSVPHR